MLDDVQVQIRGFLARAALLPGHAAWRESLRIPTLSHRGSSTSPGAADGPGTGVTSTPALQVITTDLPE